jgi:hypothetical protein
MSHVRLALLAALLASSQAYGLLTLEDGKAQVGVIGRAYFNWDSNLFNNANSQSDSYEVLVAGFTYDRNAGTIGVKGSSIWTFDFFNKFDDENSVNPAFKLGFSKAQGKTTGSLDFAYRRISQADDAANQRTRLGEFDTTLVVQYPINERFSLTSTTGVINRGYKDNTFFDNDTFSQAIDGFMVYTSKLDVVAGYRYRFTDAEGQPDSVDHAFTVGVSGKLLPKVDGSFRIGYQLRDIRLASADSLDGVTASASFIWSPRNRVLVSSQISKDFSTTSTALSSDSITWFNSVQFTTASRIALTAGAGYSKSKYYAIDTLVRTDDHYYVSLGASYPVTTNINAEITYTHSQNWSTESFADFTKDFVTVGIAAKF